MTNPVECHPIVTIRGAEGRRRGPTGCPDKPRAGFHSSATGLTQACYRPDTGLAITTSELPFRYVSDIVRRRRPVMIATIEENAETEPTSMSKHLPDAARRIIKATVATIATVTTLGILATAAQAEPITRIFHFAATDFKSSAPVGAAVLDFRVTFDPAVTVFDQTAGATLISSNLLLSSTFGFNYVASEDSLRVGGVQEGVIGLQAASLDFVATIAFASTATPVATMFGYTDTSIADIYYAQSVGLTFHEESPTTAAPEPMSLALFGMGLAGLAAVRRRKN